MASNKNKSQTEELLSHDECKRWAEKKYREEHSKGKMTRNFLIPYPEPPEVEDQIIQLNDLEDPSEDFKILDLTSRKPTMPCSIALLRFHFWNINPGRLLSNGELRLKAFTKLVYNQDEQHRVRTCGELCDLTRDAGPRLLKPEILRKLKKLPISRRHPDFPEGTDWEEQRTRSSGPTPAGSGEESEDPSMIDSNSLIQEQTPAHLHIILESLERLLIQLRYKDLEVMMPTSGETTGPHIYTNTSDGSRRKRLVPEKMNLVLDKNHNIRSEVSGIEYVYRECGPTGEIHDGYQTAFDCIMMAGKFLDTGLTKIDLEEFKPGNLQETKDHQMFVNIINTDWSTDDASEKRKHHHQFFHDLAPKDFKDLLRKSTILRPQFYHTSTCVLRCEDGHDRLARPTKQSLVYVEDIQKESGEESLSMQEVLQLAFRQCGQDQLQGETIGHGACNILNCEKESSPKDFLRSMPIRIAISLSSRVSPDSHTEEDINITFYNEQAKLETATYRWLGGIYSDAEIENEWTHYRMYWTDSVRGERSSSTISMYDPRHGNGRVIEGIAPSPNGHIPVQWWQDKFKPVIFYERVLNPDPLDVTLAAAVLGDIRYASDKGRNLLNIHEPWSLAYYIPYSASSVTRAQNGPLQRWAQDGPVEQNHNIMLEDFPLLPDHFPMLQRQSEPLMGVNLQQGGPKDLDRSSNSGNPNLAVPLLSTMDGQHGLPYNPNIFQGCTGGQSIGDNDLNLPGEQLSQVHGLPLHGPQRMLANNSVSSIHPDIDQAYFTRPIIQSIDKWSQKSSRNMQHGVQHMPRPLQGIASQPLTMHSQLPVASTLDNNAFSQSQQRPIDYGENLPHIDYQNFSVSGYPAPTGTGSNHIYLSQTTISQDLTHQGGNNVYTSPPSVLESSEQLIPPFAEYDSTSRYIFQGLTAEDQEFLDRPETWLENLPDGSPSLDVINNEFSLAMQGIQSHEISQSTDTMSQDFLTSELGVADQTDWYAQTSGKRGREEDIEQRVHKRPRNSSYLDSSTIHNPD